MASVRSAAMARYGSIYLDGLVNEAGFSFNQDLSAIERIEVLKGPSSMLFGWTSREGWRPD